MAENEIGYCLSLIFATYTKSWCKLLIDTKCSLLQRVKAPHTDAPRLHSFTFPTVSCYATYRWRAFINFYVVRNRLLHWCKQCVMTSSNFFGFTAIYSIISRCPSQTQTCQQKPQINEATQNFVTQLKTKYKNNKKMSSN